MAKQYDDTSQNTASPGPPEPPLPRVGVVHSLTAAVGLRDLVKAAAGLCQLVFLFRRDIAQQHEPLIRAARAVADVEIVTEEDAPDRLSGLGLSGLITFTDGELEFTDALQATFGLPGAPSIERPWDKLVQRQRLAEAGVCAIPAQAVDSPADLLRAARSVGVPGVLKPRRGAASTGLTFIHDENDLRSELACRLEWNHLVYEEMIPTAEHPSGVDWLADYVSVETVSDGETHHHLAVVDKLPLSVVEATGPDRGHTVRETGDVFPSRLPAPIMSEVLMLTSRALDALSIRRRVSHTELKISSSRVEIIEVNGRLGGEVTRLLNLLDGPDILRDALRVTLGLPVADIPRPRRAGFSATVYIPFPTRSGPVRSQVTRTELRSLPGVTGVSEVASYGDDRSATSFRTSNLALRADDADRLDAMLAAAVEDTIRLFSADGLANDPWSCALHDRLARRVATQLPG